MKKFKWTAEQNRALKGSIRKWEKIVLGTGYDEGIKNCPCCKKWYDYIGCFGCPISAFTGVGVCYNSPYTLWADKNYNLIKKIKTRPTALKVAKAEVAFLKKVYKAGQ